MTTQEILIQQFEGFKSDYEREIIQLQVKNERGLLSNAYQLYYEYLQTFRICNDKDIEYFLLKSIEFMNV